jgi:serine protease Do
VVCILENGDLAMAESKKHRQFPPNRLILLASTAILGVTVLLAGPGGYSRFNLPASVPSAHAAESTFTHPASFADLVAKVKPAVISVRVKIDETAKMTGMSQNG